jgi:hypothetical protein
VTYVVNNITTADAYTAAATLSCPNSVRINLDVDGAGIYYQLGENWPASQWRDEIALGPGFRSLDQRADAIRVRSQSPGSAARVTLAAYPPDEIPGAGESGG